MVERDGNLCPLAGTGDLVDLIRAGRLPAPDSRPLAGARLVAPLRPSKIVAIGLNYLDHIREAGLERPARPLVFARFPSSVIVPHNAIVVDSALSQRATPEAALEAGFGYTVANDVSARDVQFADGQWVRAKSFARSARSGP